jgi:hypothetical protein
MPAQHIIPYFSLFPSLVSDKENPKARKEIPASDGEANSAHRKG